MGLCSSCGSFWRPTMRTIRAAVAVLIFALAAGLCPAQTPANPAPTDGAAEAPPVMTVNLLYIGFIESPRRLVALVNFEGRAIAVVEGDVVGEGIRIGKVSRQPREDAF